MSDTLEAPARRRRLSRETRLLIATITVSAIVLVLLSRFRFPERPAAVPTSAPPLERLAARATYDELAAIVAGLERRIAPALVVLRLAPQRESAPRRLDDVLREPPLDASVRHVPALRINPNTAIAVMDAAVRIDGIVGGDGGAESAGLIAADPVRRLALVRVPSADTERARELPLTELRTPTYVVVAEGTRAGLTFRPVFVGSSDRFGDPRWERPLLAVSSAALVAPGALVFSLEGRFLGGAFVEGGTLAVADARDIIAAADRLAGGSAPRLVDIGISVQPLTGALAAVFGAPHGVVVASVDPDGPAAGVLEPADVITVMDDQPVVSADDWLVQIAQHDARSTVRLGVMRGREPISVSLALPGSQPAAPPSGVGLRFQRGEGSVVTGVAPRSFAETAGLRPGDLIVRAGEIAAPSPEQIFALRKKLAPGAFLLLTVDRDGRQRIAAVGAPAGTDGR